MMIGGDEGIMKTNDDATNCKKYAVKLGYWSDPYIDYFHTGFNKFDRKTPEISRGYFARVFSINHLIHKFLNLISENTLKCQIVNLGSGFDTLYWKLKDVDRTKSIKHFVDLDLPGITMKKVHQIRLKPQMLSKLGEDIKLSAAELHSSEYHLVAADLRSIKDVHKKLFTDCRLDKTVPTLFLAECVLIYMSSEESNALLSWIASSFEKSFFINYEQVNIFDRFGEIMIENLRQRHCEMLDLEPCRSLDTQRIRFKNGGWDSAEAWEMDTVYKLKLPREEVERVEKIEFLDEENLLEQLLNHYCITIAHNGFKDLPEIEEVSFD